MAREIKFRVWAEDSKMMFDWNYLQAARVLAIDSGLDSAGFMVIPTRESDKLMQYTGLKDKNGVEIYEGDIVSSVHFKDKAGRTHHLFHEVQWSEEFQGWFLLNCHSRDPKDGSIQLWIAKDEMDVIGNIYENPELLKA